MSCTGLRRMLARGSAARSISAGAGGNLGRRSTATPAALYDPLKRERDVQTEYARPPCRNARPLPGALDAAAVEAPVRRPREADDRVARAGHGEGCGAGADLQRAHPCAAERDDIRMRAGELVDAPMGGSRAQNQPRDALLDQR